MTRRILLLALTALLVVGALAFLIPEVSTGDTNCGSAIFARDVSGISLTTGDTADDDFALQSVIDECGHLIFRQRYISVLFLGSAAAAFWFSKRTPRRLLTDLPGDPII